MKPSRTDQTLVRDILKQVADTLAVVSSSDGLREHHTHVYHLKNIKKYLFAYKLVFLYLNFAAFHHVLVLRYRVGHHHCLEVAPVKPRQSLAAVEIYQLTM